jgi:hypothetical protein
MKLNSVNLQTKTIAEISPRDVTVTRTERAYQEIPGLGHETRDVLKQLNANIMLLEDLSGRLSFVMGELSSIIRR